MSAPKPPLPLAAPDNSVLALLSGQGCLRLRGRASGRNRDGWPCHAAAAERAECRNSTSWRRGTAPPGRKPAASQAHDGRKPPRAGFPARPTEGRLKFAVCGTCPVNGSSVLSRAPREAGAGLPGNRATPDRGRQYRDIRRSSLAVFAFRRLVVSPTAAPRAPGLRSRCGGRCWRMHRCGPCPHATG